MDVEGLPPVLLPILAPKELGKLLRFSLSNKATAHEGMLSLNLESGLQGFGQSGVDLHYLLNAQWIF